MNASNNNMGGEGVTLSGKVQLMNLDMIAFLSLVKLISDDSGYVSGKDAYNNGGTSTGKAALSEFVPGMEVSQEQFSYAQKVWAYAEGEFNGNHGGNAYVEQMNGIVHYHSVNRAALVTSDETGFLASLIPAYERYVAMESEAEASAWVGSIGDRITERVLVVSANTFNRIFPGTTDEGFRITYKTVSGETLVWFTQASVAFASIDYFPVGEVVHITGTVKKHTEFRGVKQTVLNRVKHIPIN